MKISICSDVHLEFGQLDLKNVDNAEVLVLSGDIVVADCFASDSLTDQGKANRFMQFLTQCSTEFQDVVMIMGNHEHYHGDFADSATLIRQAISQLPNIHFLEKESVMINGLRFFGATLWTDMNKEDEGTMRAVTYGMNDFRCVKNSLAPVNAYGQVFALSPYFVVDEFKETIRCLEKLATTGEKLVVCTHHAPSKKSIKPEYENDIQINGAYSSDLDEFIEGFSNIVLWTHGHTHSPFDYMIGNTRVVCNPRGYIGYQSCADTFRLKTVEV